MGTMHNLTFEYHLPSQAQINQMAKLREAARQYYEVIDEVLPDGPDKTFVIRQLRTVAMWCNVSVDRHADGTPRDRDVG